MQRLRFGPDVARPFTMYGSTATGALIHAEDGQFFTSVMQIPPGGRYGLHPTRMRELFLVVTGQGWLRTGDGEPVPVAAGDGLLFEGGERFEAGSDEGMTAIKVEFALGGPVRQFEVRGRRFTVQLASGSEREEEAASQLQGLLERYDLRKWLLTTDLRIVSWAIPHSHPVLTLNTRHLGEDYLALATFLHEQIHWIQEAHPAQWEAAIAEFRSLYPEAPVGYPEGAHDEYSTYLHLIVCSLEYAAVSEVLGPEEGRRVMEAWAGDHYRWIYRTVLADTERIQSVLAKHGIISR